MNIRSEEQVDKEIKRVTDSYRRLIASQQSSLAVAYVSEGSFSSDDTSDIMTKNLPIGTALFTALPAPAVPEALERMRAIVSDPRALPRRKEWISGQQYSYVLLENVEAMVDEACRAAMLAQPVIPVEPTAAMQAAGAAAIRFDTTPINKLFTANAVYRAMLAVAPEVMTKLETLPDGFKLVPIEPTEEMLAAAEHDHGLSSIAEGIYWSMLAAAPKFRG